MATRDHAPGRGLTVATLATIGLAVVATLVGLLVPDFYRDTPALLPQLYGQDLLTLVVALPALAAALYGARRGSLRARLVWLGVTAYLLYTYATYAFMAAFNELYLVYTTLLWLTLVTFVTGMLRTDAKAIARRLGEHDRRPYVVFEVGLAVLIGALWLAEILPATLEGTVPPSVAEAGLPTSVIYALDLGVILPAFLLTAWLVRRGRAWGDAFTVVLLAKGATLGAAILAMALFMIRDGQTVPAPQLVIFGLLTLASLGLLLRFLRGLSA
jgi:hypothetical protein